MVKKLSPEFINVVSKLFEALPSDGSPIDDEVLMQLHAFFGPMLGSAVQLIDRREVVRVVLPAGRHIYQITSATGSPYTLYAELPARPSVPAVHSSKQDSSLSPDDDESTVPEKAKASPEPQPDNDTSAEQSVQTMAEPSRYSADLVRHSYIRALNRSMQGMYCPCAGYGYNTLAGDRNFLVSHKMML
ncbi:hypothetical protein BD324DRAFT_618564 [Kockovaella imperatae]|uniref:Uncharacterized protein n=1 Tax=Kockovaella imperatae TaxID=4999 RepID=A0A1Y1UNS5_9TREE|nr:hypothetical protein BD324DRAFT_618564 [Kockovaella imperatae]ORX39116.1 hypothetical protein BD324DRAFT_618564 [Kockovaella imperatae]